MLLDDLRSAVRSVFRAPAVTAVLFTSLALGTGANATVFSAVQSLLFRPPAGVAQPGTLVSIYTMQFGGGTFGRSSYPDYLSLRESVSSLESIAALDDDHDVNAVLDGALQRVRVAAVSGGFFPVLGLQPLRGRLLADTDGPAAAPPPAVISAFLWQSFGGREELVGALFQLGSRFYRIVGVAPQGFRGLSAQRLCDVWIPVDGIPDDRGDRRFSLVARRRAPIERVQEELQAAGAALASRFPGTNLGTANDPNAPRRFTVTAYSQLDPEARARASTVAAIVGASVVLLLASACVNAGSLLLSRGFARRRELAVKMALGAPRVRLVRQLLLESVLLTVGGAVLGLLFAFWMGLIIPSLFAPEHAALLDTGINAPLIIVSVLVAIVAGCLFGIAPAMQSTSAPAALALRADAGGISEHEGGRLLRAVLVSSQVALSTVLLLGTGVMIGSLSAALEGDAALPTERIAIVTTEAPKGHASPVRGIPFVAELAPAIEKMPGVEAVGWSSVAPLGVGVLKDFRVQAGARATSDAAEFAIAIVSPGYFSAIGMPLVEGRAFDTRDAVRSEQVTVVDEQLARRHFGAMAVGQFLVDPNAPPWRNTWRIIGVVGSPRQRALQNATPLTAYFTLTQETMPRGYVFVRFANEAAPLLDTLQRAVNGVPGLEVDRPVTLKTYLAGRLALDRLITALVGTCGVLALLLSMIGVYGVMIDAVQRRTREIGLRVALGAARMQVARLVMTEALLLCAVGIAAGLVLSVAGDKLSATVLNGVAPLQVTAICTAPAILIAMIAAAAVVPLRRALSVSATIALRAE